jgi:hypothetical protein
MRSTTRPISRPRAAIRAATARSTPCSTATPSAYSEAQLATGRQVADLIAPFIQNIVLLQRERRRRRLRALEGLPPALGASLNVRDVFGRLADVVRPLIDFDVMGACLVSASGRELEVLGEVLERHGSAAWEWPAARRALLVLGPRGGGGDRAAARRAGRARPPRAPAIA